MNIPNTAQDVADFHVKFGINYDGPPRPLPPEIMLARYMRTSEEIHEWGQAYGLNDLPKQLDAMIDLVYFALGNLHLQGFSPDAINEAWRRVHQANMAKVRSSELNPGKHQAIGTFVDIAKPPGWVAPDLSDLCNQLGLLGEVDKPKSIYGNHERPEPEVVEKKEPGPWRYFVGTSYHPYLARGNNDGGSLSSNCEHDWTESIGKADQLARNGGSREITLEEAKLKFPNATFE